MRTLARWCFRHKWVVIAAWVIAAIGLNAIESGVGSAYSDNFKLPHTDSFDAVTLLQHNVPKASGDTDQIVIASSSGRLTDPAWRSDYTQTRPKVERKISHLMRRKHGGRRAPPHRLQRLGPVRHARVVLDIGR